MKGDVMNRNMKAQSAMEYLMTYGWAILIIAVVLGALFSLGVFSGASVLGTACIAGPGFLCSQLTYTHGNPGTVTLNIGQSTGNNWQTYNIIMAPQGASVGTGGGPTTAGSVTVLSTTSQTTLTSGQQTGTITFTLPAGTVAVGSTLAGAIWSCYSTSTSATSTQYTTTNGLCFALGVGAGSISQIATFTAKAT